MYQAAKGFVIAAFKPASPPAVPTPDAVWDAIVVSGSDYWFGVPSFLEQRARDPEKLTYMKKMRGLVRPRPLLCSGGMDDADTLLGYRSMEAHDSMMKSATRSRPEVFRSIPSTERKFQRIMSTLERSC